MDILYWFMLGGACGASIVFIIQAIVEHRRFIRAVKHRNMLEKEIQLMQVNIDKAWKIYYNQRKITSGIVIKFRPRNNVEKN